jgi:hypothetical protein
MLRNRVIPVAARYTIIAVAWLVYFSFAFYGNNDKTETTKYEISAPASASTLKGENYEDVEKRFKSSGFKNISFKPMGDLVTGWINEDGEVDKISINGQTDFSSYDKFPPEADVVITYHSYSSEEEQNEDDANFEQSNEEKVS